MAKIPMAEKKFLRVADDTFQEIETGKEEADGCRWHKEFSMLSFILNRITIETTGSVNDLGSDLIRMSTKSFEAHVSEQICISGVVNEEHSRSSLYTTYNCEDGSVIQVDTPSSINFRIYDKKPMEKSPHFNAGVYRGSLTTGFELDFLLGAPKDQLLSLISCLRAAPNSNIHVTLYAQGFCRDVTSRYIEMIVMDGLGACFLKSICIIEEIGHHDHSSKNDATNHIASTQEQEISDDYGTNQEILKVLSSYLKTLNSLVVAIWILIAVISLSAFLD